MSTESRQLAVIADVHGNTWALRAVLDDIAATGVKPIVSLGDNLYGPLDPRGTLRLMLQHSIPSVSGNQDEVLTRRFAGKHRGHHSGYVLSQLDAADIDWLDRLESILYPRDDVCLCHATPTSSDNYLLFKVTANGVTERPENEIRDLLGNCNARVVVCGHSHVPAMRSVNDCTIINVGSVGLQAYDDDSPYMHCMENGNPLARYAVLTLHDGGCEVESHEVAYDWNAAAAAARKNGSPDWEHWLKTGTVRK